MEELKISDMLKMQIQLWEKNKENWPPMEPKDARNSLLWMIEELGEVIAIIKKKGEDSIMSNDNLKSILLEELVDVFMYYLDVLNRYNISGEDFTNSYRKKHEYNIGRNYKKQHNDFLSDKKSE